MYSDMKYVLIVHPDAVLPDDLREKLAEEYHDYEIYQMGRVEFENTKAMCSFWMGEPCDANQTFWNKDNAYLVPKDSPIFNPISPVFTLTTEDPES